MFLTRRVNGVITVRLGQVLRLFPRMLFAGAKNYDCCQGCEKGENRTLHAACCSSECQPMQPRITAYSLDKPTGMGMYKRLAFLVLSVLPRAVARIFWTVHDGILEIPLATIDDGTR
ncbi:MAG: hypothetical protein O3C21_01015, partial [Verrucomicrobia bacterium]|nr:hypothetical protein [Verrucomicrobiota bacterium]